MSWESRMLARLGGPIAAILVPAAFLGDLPAERLLQPVEYRNLLVYYDQGGS